VPDILEYTCIKICKPNSKPFFVATWYRPPNTPINIFNAFETFVGRTDCGGEEFYILGDINCDVLAYPLDGHTKALNQICDVYQLFQMINKPTRVTPSTSTLIDLVLTNCPEKVVCSGMLNIDISDHDLLNQN